MKILMFTLLSLSCSDYKLSGVGSADPGSELPELDTAYAEELPPVDTGVDEPAEEPPPVEDPPEEEPDPTAPVAICDVTPDLISPPFEVATWIGEDSFDPGGERIEQYNWQLISAPEGSTVTMPFGGANRGPFTPVLAGEYTARLTVTNESGIVSDPCETTLEAVPDQNLWVEMFWSEFQDDMDLHLLAPGGSLETRTDCYYSNCTESAQLLFPMDWGISGYTEDNHVLDLDDLPGTGPENINIADPVAGGVYTVVVHDYTGSTPDFYGGNEVTVNIYLDGILAWTDTRIIEGDGSYTYFADIDWASMTITSL